MNQASEVVAVHTRIMKCALEVEDARAFWQHVQPGHPPTAEEAFQGWWFGARSLDRVAVLLSNFELRFSAYPDALRVLHAWREMEPDTRALVCHWHLQLADPLYRDVTGDFFHNRRQSARPEITRDRVVAWVAEHGESRWTMATRIQFASKLLSAAFGAGLVGSNRDPRPLPTPRVRDDALSYLLHLLRGLRFQGTMLDNPYLRSIGLEGSALEDRLRGLPSLSFSRQGDLVDFGWRHADLLAWARDGLGLSIDGEDG
jgi:hypothetical protein